jgi:hypothetical protein
LSCELNEAAAQAAAHAYTDALDVILMMARWWRSRRQSRRLP